MSDDKKDAAAKAAEEAAKKAAEEAAKKAAEEAAKKAAADAEEAAKATKIREAKPNEYPKMLYFKGDVTNYKVVDSVAAEDALGEDWLDAPQDPAG